MKNFFGFYETDKNEAGDIAGAEFRTRRIAKSRSEEFDQRAEQAESLDGKVKLPAPLRLVQTVSLYAGLFLILISLGAALEIGFKTAYGNAPAFFWIAGGLLALWLGLFIAQKLRERSVTTDAEFNREVEELVRSAEELVSVSMQELGIPEDAPSIDVFTELFKIKKNGKVKRKLIGLSAEFANIGSYIFLNGENLCLADLDSVYEIPLSSIRSITLMKKRAMFFGWNKDEAYNSPKYKPYKIKINQYGVMFAKYYRVELFTEKGEFYILLPEYDGGIFMGLTRLLPSREE